MRTLFLRPLGSLLPLVVALSLAVATLVSPPGMAMAQQPQADVVDTLKGDGPFTVFAPTDEAFAKLPAGTLEALLADPAKLQAVLTYHVVPGRVTAADVATLSSAATVQGSPIAIDTSMGVRVNDAHVTQADVMTSNGVIHVIDTVLLPPGL